MTGTLPLESNADLAVTTIGFGEAAQAFSEGWRQDNAGLVVSSFDIKTDSSEQEIVDNKLADYKATGINGCHKLADALAQAKLVFSLVTADQALEAAKAASISLQPGSFYFDCNSCAPQTKQEAAIIIGEAGGHYIDVAVLAPVYPKLHKAPLLVAGVKAKEAHAILDALGMEARIIAGEVGRASSVKMIRSVMVKGMEALTLECVLTAQKADVLDEVIASLNGSHRGFEWFEQAGYNLERSTTHGIRRAAEMREVVKTVRGFGFEPRMAAATVDWQQQAGDLKLRLCEGDYASYAATIIDEIVHKKTDLSSVKKEPES